MQHEPKSSEIRDVLRHYLGEIVYGGNDGIVTTFAVISGVAGADLSVQAMLVIGIVNLVADGFSMGASNYLSIRSKADAQGISRGASEPIAHAVATFISFAFFGSMPIIGFFAHEIIDVDPFLLSAIVTAITMFVLGALRASVGRKKWYLTGLENLIIGAIASLVAYYCGKLLSSMMLA